MAFEQAREFLARVVAWPQEGDASAFVNLHWTFYPADGNVRTDAKGKPILPWSGRAVRTLDQAINSLQFQTKAGSNTRDIYLCLSTQATAKQKVGKNNHVYYTPVRLQETAVALKSIFLDVDFKGGEHGYDTPDEAVAALAQFIQDVNLPKPTAVVKSGGGLHVYWCVAHSLTRDEWQPLAFALAEATKRHGLKCDSQCTIDSARVLRVPDTLNFKSNPPRPVTLAGKIREYDYTVERLWQALEPYKVSIPTSSGRSTFVFEVPGGEMPQVFKNIPLADELGANIGPDYDPVHLDDLAKVCGFIDTAIKTGGRDYSNPLWNLTTLIATFTDNPRVDAHRMGNQHPGYSKESTDDFFDRKDRERVQKGLGFPSCATISGSGCKSCQGCPHFSAARSPLAAGRAGLQAAANPQAAVSGAGSNSPVVSGAGAPTVAGAAVLAPAPPGLQLPDNYVRDPNTQYICVVEHDLEGKQKLVPVCEYEMLDPWLQKPERVLHFTAKVDMTSMETISIPNEVVNTMEMRRLLQAQGLMIPAGDKSTQRMGNFLMSWIRKLQQTRDSVMSAPFGWTVEHGKVNGFVFNGTVFMKSGTRQAAQPDPVLQRQYTPQGEMQPWLDMADFVTSQGRHDLNAILASAFAAPLVRFTGHMGALMSAYSNETGVGKTTAQKIAQAVWGDPVSGIQSLGDTQNAVMNKLGTLRSLPLYWDEIKTEEQTKSFVNITFQTSLGKEKARMSRDIRQREPGRWQTLLVCCSNDSLLNYVMGHNVTSDAGMCRIFEFPVKKVASPLDTSTVQIMLSKLNDNYGHAGLQYANFLGANFDTIEKEMGELMKVLEKTAQAQQDERFWIALIGTILLGAKYANQLGLTKIDVPGLKDFMLGQLERLRMLRVRQGVDMSKMDNLMTTLQRFLATHRAKHTLVSNRINQGRGRPHRNAIRAIVPTDPTRLDGIYVQIGVDDKIIRIASTRLTQWLRENRINRNDFVSRLENELGFKDVVGSIGSGLGPGFNQLQERLLEIDCNGKQELEEFIDGFKP